MDSSGSRHEQMVGSCEHGNKTSGSTTRGELIDWLRNFLFLKKDSAPRSQLTGWLVVWLVGTFVSSLVS